MQQKSFPTLEALIGDTQKVFVFSKFALIASIGGSKFDYK